MCSAATSKRQAREFLSSNAIQINGDRVNDVNFIISKDIAIDGKFVIVLRGKKNYYMIRFE